MNIKEWLEENAELTLFPGSSSRTWVTKARGDYIAHEGAEDDSLLKVALGCGVTEHVSSSWEAGKPVNIGFNPEEQKWYGWSHRTIYGFGVGSKCSKGDVHYLPTDKDDFLDSKVMFWWGADYPRVVGRHEDNGICVEINNSRIPGKVDTIYYPYPDKYGRGEWTAETLADARQMAIDFAEGVA